MITMLTKDGVYTPSVSAPEVILNGSSLKQVTQDDRSTSPDYAVSALALWRAISNLKATISDIQVEGKLLSASIVSPTWSTLAIDPNKGWTLGDSFSVSAGILSTIDTAYNPNSNTCVVPNGRFFAQGQYYLHLNVLMNHDGFTVTYGDEPPITVTTEGPIGFVFDVTDQTKTLTITANYPGVGVTFALGEVYLVYVNPTLRDYVETAVDKLFYDNIDGLATITMLQGAVTSMQLYTDASLVEHIDSADPHEQYVLRSEAYAALRPNRIKTNQVGQKLIEELDPTDIIVKTNFLSHIGDDYDPSTGLISADSPSLTPLHYAVQISRTPQARKTLFSLTNDEPTLRYDFIAPVSVRQVTLYLDSLPISAEIETVVVTVGSFSQTITVAPYRPFPSVGHVSINVTVPDVITTALTISVVQTSGDPAGTIAIGFSVAYTASTTSDLVLPQGLVFDACTSPNVVKRFTTDVDVNLMSSGLYDRHPYVLALTANDPTGNTTYTLTPIPYAPAVVDAFNRDTFSYGLKHLTAASSYYGDVTLVSTGASIRQIYTSQRASVQVHNDTIRHMFGVAMNVGIVKVYLDIGLHEVESINIKLTTTGGATTDYTPTYSINYTTRKVVATFVIPDGLITQFDITTTSLNPLTVNNVSVGFRTLFYDAVTNMWSDGITRILLGWVTRYGGSRISFIPTFTRDRIDMITTAYPDYTDYYGRVVRMQNPAFTDKITIHKKPAIIINQVTPEYIEYTQVGSDITTLTITR